MKQTEGHAIFEKVTDTNGTWLRIRIEEDNPLEPYRHVITFDIKPEDLGSQMVSPKGLEPVRLWRDE